jgi:hypothetical protein
MILRSYDIPAKIAVNGLTMTPVVIIAVAIKDAHVKYELLHLVVVAQWLPFRGAVLSYQNYFIETHLCQGSFSFSLILHVLTMDVCERSSGATSIG